jgi:precorrin-6B methylase 2
MMKTRNALAFVAMVVAATALSAKSQTQMIAEMKTAEHEIPMLVDVLKLNPGMTVADVGAGNGAMTVVLAKWIGPSGRVFATDIGAKQLQTIRAAVDEAGLKNVTVLEGAAAATNLPLACCDAIFMRDVYHHILMDAQPAFDKSVAASLKPGGRLAIIDFEPRGGTKVPDGVNPNRVGHGITAAVVSEEITVAGLKAVQTLNTWPPDSGDKAPFFLVLFQKP